MARRMRRWEAFRLRLLENGILGANASGLQPNGSFNAFEDWPRQAAIEAQGLATDPLFAKFLAFQAQHSG